MSSTSNNTNLNTVSNRIKQSVFKMPSSKSSNSDSKSFRLINTVDSKNQDNIDCYTANNSKPNSNSKSNSSQQNHHTTSSSLKSSVKRLFSPSSCSNKSNHHINSSTQQNVQILNAPSGASSSVINMTTPVLNKKHKQPTPTTTMSTHSIRQHVTTVVTQSPVPSIVSLPQMSIRNLNPSQILGNTHVGSITEYTSLSSSSSVNQFKYGHENHAENKSFENSSSVSMDSKSTNCAASSIESNNSEILSTSTSSATSTSTTAGTTSSSFQPANKTDTSLKSSKKKNDTSSNQCSAKANTSGSQSRSTPTNSLKKHLNILKNNSKKVLLGSSSSTNASATSSNSINKQAQLAIKSSPVLSTKASSLNSTKSQNQSVNTSPSQLNTKLHEYETKINELNNEINMSQRNTSESQGKIKDLQLEIERLSRLYDFEINKKSKYEEKILSLKQLAEEKQIESAAIKFEYRKVQELKESLASENAYLKSLLNNSECK